MKKDREHSKLTDEEKKEILQDLDSDGTAIEIAEAMIAVDPSKETKKAADKLVQEADSSKDS